MITIAIVAHVKRETMAKQLAVDVEADQPPFLDDGTLGCEGNHRRVWQWHQDNTTTEWSVVLEDDAQPVEGFLHQLDTALRVAPTPIVGLYLGHPSHWMNYPDRRKAITRAGQQADQVAACWLTTQDLLHGVGVAIHTEIIPSMLDSLNPGTPVDYAIRNWARTTGHTIGFTWPSLVDHADTPSLAKHHDGRPRTKERKAWRTGTRTHWISRAVTFSDAKSA